MKIAPTESFNSSDIREQLKEAHFELPTVYHLPCGLDIKKLRTGSATHLYVWDDPLKRAVGVVTVQRDKLLGVGSGVAGIVAVQAGLLQRYRGLGVVSQILDAVGRDHRVFAGSATTRTGIKMWMNRIKVNHSFVFLGYTPNAFPDKQHFTVLRGSNIKAKAPLLWDGSLKTRILQVPKGDAVIKRFKIDLKGG